MQLGAGTSSHVHTEGPAPLAGPITYRHLLSAGSLNPANPLRVIAHCDVDAAYAAFEAKRLGLDPHKVPIAVQQWNGLIAISYAARKFGITRHETVESARAKCPELIFAHVATYAEGSDHAEYHEDPRPETHKVSLDPYRRESRKILEIFKKTCPAGAVEKASIDESFFDLTIEVRKAMLEDYPELRTFPPDSATGMDTPLPTPPQDAQQLWAHKGHLIPIEGDVGEGQDVNTETKKAKAEKLSALKQGKVRLAKGARTMAPSFDTSESLKKLQAATAAAAVVESSDAQVPGGDAAMGRNERASPTDIQMEEEHIVAPTSAQPSTALPAEEHSDDGPDQNGEAAEVEFNEVLALEEASITWQDVALAVGAKLMNKVRAAVKEELGYTTSAGIASNKTMAKLCSGWRKPNAQTIMRPAAVKNFLRVLPFQKIRFLGGKLGDAMANEWQSATVGDLWTVTLEQMQARFGEDSGWVYNVLRGIDYSEVKERVANKTMLASKNVRPIITTWAQGQHWLSILATELAIRLAEGRESEPNLWPRTLVLRYIRIGDSGRSRQAAFPYARELTADVVRKAAEKLWRDAFGDLARPLGGGGGGGAGSGTGSPTKSGGGGGSEVENKEVKPGIVTIALGFSGLEKTAETGQRRLDQTFFMKGAQSQQAGPPSAATVKRTGSAFASDAAASSSSGLDEEPRSSAVNLDDESSGPISRPPRKKQKKLGPLESMLQTQQQRQQDTPAMAESVAPEPEAGDTVTAAASVSGPDDPEVRAETARKALPSWTCPQCGEVLRPPLDLFGPPPPPDIPQPNSRREKGKALAPWPFDEDDADITAAQAQSSADPAAAASSLSPAALVDATEAFSEEDAQAWLDASRVAHEDEHFARQLQREEDKRNKVLVGSQAYAAARAAAGSASSSSGGSGSGPQRKQGRTSSGGGKSGGSGSRSSAGGKGRGKAKGAGSGAGSIASFFSQQPWRD
ncbi:hypothetical protein V8E36_000120 [Tilletia maclaganii]